MATDFYAEAAKANRPAIQASGGGISENSGSIELAAALILADTIVLCKLPAGEVPVDLIGHVDDLDSDGSPALVMNVGLLDVDGAGDDPDCFVALGTIGQAAGIWRMSAVAAREIAPRPRERLVVATVTTAPATGAAGGIGATLLSRAQGLDDTPGT